MRPAAIAPRLDRRFARGAVSPTLQSWMAYLQGETLLDADPATASAAFSRAIELADAAGSTYVGGSRGFQRSRCSRARHRDP